MNTVIFIAKTFLPATNSANIQGLFLTAERKGIRIPSDNLPEGMYHGVVADILNYIQPYVWEDPNGKHLKLALACTLINHETGEKHEFGISDKGGSMFHIRKEDSLMLSAACPFSVTINDKGFIARFHVVDRSKPEPGISESEIVC